MIGVKYWALSVFVVLIIPCVHPLTTGYDEYDDVERDRRWAELEDELAVHLSLATQNTEWETERSDDEDDGGRYNEDEDISSEDENCSGETRACSAQARAPSVVHGFAAPLQLEQVLTAVEAAEAAATLQSLRPLWRKRSYNEDHSSAGTAGVAEAERLGLLAPFFYTLGPASAYVRGGKVASSAEYAHEVARVVPVLRNRLGWLYDRVLVRLKEHLQENCVRWKPGAGLPGWHLLPIGDTVTSSVLAVQRAGGGAGAQAKARARAEAFIADAFVAPHVDQLHTAHEWPAPVQRALNKLPTISATLPVRLPRDAQGLRVYRFHWDKVHARLLFRRGDEVDDSSSSNITNPAGTNLQVPRHDGINSSIPHGFDAAGHQKPTLADAHEWATQPSFWHVHRYKVGALSLHSGDEYHCQEYPKMVDDDDWRLTLQLHGLWTGECWELFW